MFPTRYKILAKSSILYAGPVKVSISCSIAVKKRHSAQRARARKIGVNRSSSNLQAPVKPHARMHTLGLGIVGIWNGDGSTHITYVHVPLGVAAH